MQSKPTVTPANSNMSPHMASPKAAHLLSAQPSVPSIADHELPQPAVTPSKSDVVTCPHTLGMPVTPHACTPLSPTKGLMSITTPPQAPPECGPTTIIHGLHNLSMLHSDTLNPWDSLCPHYYHCLHCLHFDIHLCHKISGCYASMLFTHTLAMQICEKVMICTLIT
jgi:hypothetical protein